MGIYLNPDNDGFRTSVNSKIYVDKTGMIAYTNECLHTKQAFICVSRPHRFGKSMALEMLAAYYSCGCDSRDLFSRYKIAKGESFEKHLNRYNVIFLNMQRFLSRAKHNNMLEYLEQTVMEELKAGCAECEKSKAPCLSALLEEIYAKTKKDFIFLIDEWDCVMRKCKDAEGLQKQYLDFLQDLLKDQSYVALAYMTGILPVKKYVNPTELGMHSALNMFREFSMTNPMQLEEYVGFTEEEVQGLCETYHMDFAQMQNWYDGYSFRNFTHIYNPGAVVEAMLSGQFSNYWTSTGTYEALKIYIDMDYDGLRESIIELLGGAHIGIVMGRFQNDMHTFETKDDIMTLLIHLGYLAYDVEKKEAFIPNWEIMEEFELALGAGGWKEIMDVLEASDKLLEDTLAGNAAGVASALDRAHTGAASILTYNDENSLSCTVISLAYYSARRHYRMIWELPSGKGDTDIVFLPLRRKEKPAIVVKLKAGKKADSAVAQIKEKNYAQALERYCGEILLVSITYDKKTKKHECVIERHNKTRKIHKDAKANSTDWYETWLELDRFEIRKFGTEGDA